MGIVFIAIVLCSTLAAARAGGITGGYGLSYGGGYGIGYGVSGAAVGNGVAFHDEGPLFSKAAPGSALPFGPAHHANKLDVGTAVIVQSILGGNGGFNPSRLLNKGGS
ncbi:hypothetical protein MTO96_033776 [Rhipicephalus appendiculatus]